MRTIYKRLVSVIVISFMAGCAATIPIVRAPGKSTLPAWMCDGSAVRFNDTKRLIDNYEGLIDEFVAEGELAVPCRASGYDGEAEWAIMFPEPLINYDGMPEKETEVVIYGMIEGKDLQDLSNPCESGWIPSSTGNNVLTSGLTLKRTTLAEFKNLSHDELRLKVSVLRPGNSDEEPIHYSYIGDLDLGKGKADLGLRGKLLNDIIGKVAKELRESDNPKASKVRLLNLAVAGDDSAAVQDTNNRILGMLMAVPGYPVDSLRCLRLLSPMHEIRARVAYVASWSRKTAHAGDEIVLRLQEKSNTNSDQYNTIATARLKLTQN